MISDWAAYAPFVAVLGPIIGAAIGGAVTYFVVTKRKVVTFVVGASEDLTAALRGGSTTKRITVKVGEHELTSLNRGSIIIRNTGNTPINDLRFDLVVEGDHPFSLTEVKADDLKLRNSVKVSERGERSAYDPVFEIELPFFNPAEAFEVAVFYDGPRAQLKVYFRMDGVAHKIKSDGGLGISREAASHIIEVAAASAVRGMLGGVLRR